MGHHCATQKGRLGLRYRANVGNGMREILQNGDNSVTTRSHPPCTMEINPWAGFRVLKGSFLQGTRHTGDGNLSEAFLFRALDPGFSRSKY